MPMRRATPFRPKMRDRIAKIEVETGHLVQMVNELLDLARIESGGPLLLLDDVDLGRVVRESVERLRLFADRQGLRPRRGCPGPAAARPRRRGADRPGRRQSRPQRAQVRRRTGDVTIRVRRGRRARSSPRSRTTGPASRRRTRRGSSSGSTRSTGRGSGAAERAWASRSPATCSSSTAAGSGSSRRRARARRSRSRCRFRPARTRQTEADAPAARGDAQHPQPRRPMARATAADPGRHERPPAGRARSPGVRLSDAAGPADRGGGRGPVRARCAAGPAGPSTGTRCSSASRWRPRTRRGWTSG